MGHDDASEAVSVEEDHCQSLFFFLVYIMTKNTGIKKFKRRKKTDEESHREMKQHCPLVKNVRYQTFLLVHHAPHVMVALDRDLFLQTVVPAPFLPAAAITLSREESLHASQR